MHKGIANNEYEIENILYEVPYGNKIMYLVKWKNYPSDQCTWEPYRNLTNCQDVLNTYRINRSISSEDIYKSDGFLTLFNMLNTFTDQELIQTLHRVVNDIPIIEPQFIHGTIAYLSTFTSDNRDAALTNLARQNLLLIEVQKKRSRQLEKLTRWQVNMNLVVGFTITVENSVDFEGPPKKFKYVAECVPGNGVTIPDDPPLWCQCDKICVRKKGKNKTCNHFDEYQSSYNKFKRVTVPPGTPIYECNKRCPCDNTCFNRVVQHGPNNNYKMQIFRTDNNRGWGVKTLAPIKRGSYVSKYTGEIITRQEAEERARSHGSKSTYMFDLDYNTDKNDCLYSIDATEYGNISHFINHSCDANLVIYAVWIECLDPYLPTLALFATKDIGIGEELTFNYMTSVDNESRRIKCKCQSSNCRGYLC